MKKESASWRWAMLSLLFTFSFLFSSMAGEMEVVRKKEYNQSYAAQPGNTLTIDNRYGSITITHWGKSEVAMRVVVESKARRESDAQANLDRINVHFAQTGTQIMAKTETNFSQIRNASLSIHYYVSMPDWIHLDLNQSYGNILLPKTSNNGRCACTVKYGNIEGGVFSQPLKVDLRYGNLRLSEVNEARLSLKYTGKMTIGKATNLHLESAYSDLSLGEVKEADMECSYGKVKIDQVTDLELEIRYGEVAIDRLLKSFDCDNQSYTDIKISEVDENFESIKSESHYGNLTVNVPKHSAMKLYATGLKYGDCEIDSSLNKTKYEKDEENVTAEFNGGGSSRIEFDGGKYGSLIIKAY